MSAIKSHEAAIVRALTEIRIDEHRRTFYLGMADMVACSCEWWKSWDPNKDEPTFEAHIAELITRVGTRYEQEALVPHG